MEGDFQKHKEFSSNFSVLLESSASDDLADFKSAIEENGLDVDEAGLWYGRRLGSNKMGFEERTPLMIAAMFGSKQVLHYILTTDRVDVNQVSQTDGATALHCAVAGGSISSPDVIKALLDASADANSVDFSGNRPADLITCALSSFFNLRRKKLEVMLKGCTDIGVCLSSDKTDRTEDQKEEILMQEASRDGSEKKEYPIDLSLPDIKNGIFGTDEFRMYTFKVKPCSRAYSHDWTECPFAHPGENARRRDPRKYHYSCVPCPEFRKGSCRQGDTCEYAHGIFECWLHPAQYRTRLCKDEIGCNRRVCFFAHKPEELRPVCSSTGSAVLSPRSYSANASSLDIGSITPLALGSPSALMSPTSAAPMTPPGGSSPRAGGMWQNQPNIVPPTLQLPGSRLKSALSARDMDLDAEISGLEGYRLRQQLMNEISGLSSPSRWNSSMHAAGAFGTSSGDRIGEFNRIGGVQPTNLENRFGSLNPTMLSQFQGLSLDAAVPHLQSPNGTGIRQNMNQPLRSSYPTSLSSSPVCSSSFGADASRGAMAAALSSRSAAFAKRSQSFIERSAVNGQPGRSATAMPSSFPDWGSPDGKLDWCIQGEELNKLRKSASFRSNSGSSSIGEVPVPGRDYAPNVSRVQSLANDTQTKHGQLNSEDQQYHLSSGGFEALPPWLEQLYMEQEQMVA